MVKLLSRFSSIELLSLDHVFLYVETLSLSPESCWSEDLRQLPPKMQNLVDKTYNSAMLSWLSIILSKLE